MPVAAGVASVLRCVELSPTTQDGIQPLHIAAQEGDLAVAEYLSRRGAEASAITNDARQPLHIAAVKGHIAFVAHLTSRNAEPRPAKHGGSQPIHVAAQQGHVAVAEHLIRGGAGVRGAEASAATTTAGSLCISPSRAVTWLSWSSWRQEARVVAWSRVRPRESRYSPCTSPRKLAISLSRSTSF